MNKKPANRRAKELAKKMGATVINDRSIAYWSTGPDDDAADFISIMVASQNTLEPEGARERIATAARQQAGKDSAQSAMMLPEKMVADVCGLIVELDGKALTQKEVLARFRELITKLSADCRNPAFVQWWSDDSNQGKRRAFVAMLTRSLDDRFPVWLETFKAP